MHPAIKGGLFPAAVAQSAGRPLCKRRDVGSNPTGSFVWKSRRARCFAPFRVGDLPPLVGAVSILERMGVIGVKKTEDSVKAAEKAAEIPNEAARPMSFDVKPFETVSVCAGNRVLFMGTGITGIVIQKNQ